MDMFRGREQLVSDRKKPVCLLDTFADFKPMLFDFGRGVTVM